jgi:protein-tyrosine sulfotransferase
VTLADRVRNRTARVRQLRWRHAAHASPERHIVIGGSPRSGTTLLRRQLDRHPGVCCGPESGLFLPGRIVVEPLAVGFGMTVDEIVAMQASSTSQAAFIDAFAARYRELRGRARWAEKTPLDIRHLDWIVARFPKVRIIHVLRDGRDVVCSMREHPDRRWVSGGWVKVHRPQPIEAYAARWARDTAAGMAMRSDPRYREVRYEDLVADPVGTLTSLCEWLGEGVDATWLDGIVNGLPSVPRVGIGVAPDDVGKPDARGGITTTSVGRWQQDLTGADRDVVRRIAGARLVELGYAIDERW